MDYREFRRHFPKKVSRELVDFVSNVVFLKKRYIFTRREGNQQYGYCTHCRKEYKTDGLRHKMKDVICTKCKSVCEVRASGVGRKYMVDEAYCVYYEKSIVNPEAITARLLYVIRDYREDYRKVQTQFDVQTMYLFEPGQSHMFDRQSLWYDARHKLFRGTQRFLFCKTIHSFEYGRYFHKPYYTSYESIEKAVKGTPFQYSTWEQYKTGDMVRFFDVASKYQCIEYLTKLGFKEFVEAKVNGGKTFGAINWNAKSPLKVLRINKQELNELQTIQHNYRLWSLRLKQISNKDGSNYKFKDLIEISKELHSYDSQIWEKALKHASLRELINFAKRQLRKPKDSKHYFSIASVIHTWMDYIKDCETLGLDLNKSAVKFPSKLYEAHQNTLIQVKVRIDQITKERIAARVQKLMKLAFEHNGLFIRPAASAKELINEGKHLQHCIGTYAEDFSKGVCDILFVRRVDEPDKPFYTLEIRQGRVKQCRGYKNRAKTTEVEAFVELFKREKLTRKNRAKVGAA